MPKTRPQKVFFSIVMAVLMVYPMELYNLALQEGGLTNGMLWRPLLDLPLMGVLVILLESLITGPIARRVMRKHFDPAKDKPIFCTLAVQWMTVTLMCPMMSLAATLIFKQPGWETPAVFLQTFACNFPAALLWQLFFAGPICRWLLKLVFRTGKSQNPAGSPKEKAAQSR